MPVLTCSAWLLGVQSAGGWGQSGIEGGRTAAHSVPRTHSRLTSTFIVLSLNPLLASPVWMHALQTLGFVMGTVALGLGFALAGGWEAKDSSE